MASEVDKFLSLSELSPLPLPWLVLPLLIIVLSTPLLLQLLPSWASKGSSLPLPPGPFPWPIVGNIPQIASDPLPYLSLARLAKMYGPIMSLRVGNAPTVIISSAAAAREVLKESDSACSGRPLPMSANIVTHDGKDIGFSPPGPYHKLVRKLCAMNLFTRKRLDAWKPARLEEMAGLCDAVTQEAKIRDGRVTLRNHLSRATLNNVLRMSVGRRFEFSVPGRLDLEADNFNAVTDELFQLLGSFNLADYVPILRPFDPLKIEARCGKVRDYLTKWIGDEIESHRKKLSEKKSLSEGNGKFPQDFCDALLLAENEEKLGEIEMIQVLQDMILAGTDTSAGTVEWAMVELLSNPEILSKLTEEVGTVFGKVGEKQDGNGLVSEEKTGDLESRLLELPYLKAVVKETLRHRTVGPLLVPHLTVENVILVNEKYHVPRGTMIQINQWAIHHDPATWQDPHVFNPERFVEKDLDIRGTDFSFLPFGSGRRMCPAYALGYPMVALEIAHLVHNFEWSLVEGNLPDTSAKFGLTVWPATPLEAIVKPRK